MLERLTTVVRARYSIRGVATWLPLFGALYLLTRDASTVVGLAIGVTVVEFTRVLRELPGVDGRRVDAAVGGCIAAVSAGWLGYEATVGATGVLWLPALATLAGVWLLLDARRDLIEDVPTSADPTEDMSSAEVFAALSHAQLLAEELREGPKTVPELATACDLTESRVRESLSYLTDDGTVYRVDNGDDDPAAEHKYALDESRIGVPAFVKLNGTRLVRRLLRPLRI